MKQLTFVFALLFTLTVKAQTFSSAQEYNDYIVNVQVSIGEKMLAFNDIVGDESATLEYAISELNAMVAFTDDAIAKAAKITPFEKNIELKESALALFRFYRQILNEDYRKMVQIYFDTNLNEASLEEMQAILDSISQREAPLDDRFQSAQQAFAERYNLELLENELQEEIDVINEGE
ncbi:MAG: LIC11966 family surface protein [Fluviicola sp.]|jgi:hypothetical protein